MTALYLTGALGNVLSRPNVVVTPTNVNSLFPTARLYDGRCGEEFRFNAVGTDQTIVVSANLLPDPGAEASGAGWSSAVTGSGTATILGSGDTGTKAFQCTAGTGSATWYVDISVRAGERLKIDARMAENSTGTARLRLRNLTTGNYLTSGAAWQAASADVFTETTTAYVTKALQFQMESMAVCFEQPTVLLRVSLVVEGAVGVGQFDTLGLYPGISFASLHGWGVGMGPLTLTVESNAVWDGSGAYTSRATMVKAASQFYSTFAVVYALWWRLKLTGTSLVVPGLGEMVLGYAETAPVNQRYDWVITSRQPQVRLVTPGGDAWVYRMTQEEIRGLRLEFQMTADSTLITAFRDELLRRSGYGDHPIVFVPYTVEPGVIHGRIADQGEITRAQLDVWSSDLMIEGSGMPTTGL